MTLPLVLNKELLDVVRCLGTLLRWIPRHGNF
jgi:hypothetical protein